MSLSICTYFILFLMKPDIPSRNHTIEFSLETIPISYKYVLSLSGRTPQKCLLLAYFDTPQLRLFQIRPFPVRLFTSAVWVQSPNGRSGGPASYRL